MLWLDSQSGRYRCAVTQPDWRAKTRVAIAPVIGTRALPAVHVNTRSLQPWDESLCDKPTTVPEPTICPAPRHAHLPKADRQHGHDANKRGRAEDDGPQEPILSPVTVGTSVDSAAHDIILGSELIIEIPRASPQLRAATMTEGAPNWRAVAEDIAARAQAELQEHVKADNLLTQAQMSKPHRLGAAANLVPYLPLPAVLNAIGVAQTNTMCPNNALRLMLDYVCRWNVSTISGAASAWFRHRWLCKRMNIPPSQHFEGPVFTALFRCERASQDARAAFPHARVWSPPRRTGQTLEHSLHACNAACATRRFLCA